MEGEAAAQAAAVVQQNEPNDTLKLVSINKHYLCGGGSLEVGKQFAHVTQQNLQDTIRLEVIDNWHKRALGPFNILENAQFAVYHFLNRIGVYYAGDFTPICESDKRFLRDIRRIWSSLISKAFFGEVWVAYGEDLLQQEKKAVEKTKTDWYLPQHFPKSKLRLYIREKSDKGKNQYTFKSVWTHATNIEIDPEKAVHLSVFGLDNFISWYKIILDFLAGHNRTINLFTAATKQIKADVSDEVAYKAELEDILTSNSPVLKINRADMFLSNRYEPFEGVKMESVQAAIGQNQALFGIMAAFNGFFNKDLSEGGEEPNQASTFIDFKHVNNVQQAHLQILQAFAEDLKESYPEYVPNDFDIVVNSNKPHEDGEFEDMSNFKGPGEEPNEQGTNQNSERFHTT